MGITDPVADMLSAIDNAAKVGKAEVVVPYSIHKEQLALLLKKEGFVAEVRKFKEKRSSCFSLAVKPAYGEKGKVKINRLRRISKPGQRIYSPASKLKSPSLGVKIISTSRGLFTEKEARKRRLGGEIIAEVW